MGKINRKIKQKLFLTFIILFVCLFLIFVIFQKDLIFNTIKPNSEIKYNNDIVLKKAVINSPVLYLEIEKQIPVFKNINISLVRHAVFSGVGLAVTDDKDVFINWIPEGELSFNKGSDADKSLGDVLDWWKFEDIDANDTKELMSQSVFVGTAGVHPFYLYSYNNGKFSLLLKLIQASSKTEVKDLNNDGQKEIIHQFSLSGSGAFDRATLRWKDIWRLKDGNPVKVNNEFPDQYPELIDIYKEPLLSKEHKFFHPVFLCLKEKAESNINGVFADSEDCATMLHKQYEEVFAKREQK